MGACRRKMKPELYKQVISPDPLSSGTEIRSLSQADGRVKTTALVLGEKNTPQSQGNRYPAHTFRICAKGKSKV